MRPAANTIVRSLHWLLTCSSVTLVGCGDSETVQVAGKVTVAGDNVAQGTIGFFPTNGQGPSAEAVIDDGRYTATLTPGQKKIVIHGYRQVGEKFPWGRNAQSMPVLEEIVPEDYNTTSSLTADVQTDRDDLDFELNAREPQTN